MCSRNLTSTIFHPVGLCSGLAACWSAAGRRPAAEAGERVPSALSCLYKTAVRLRVRTLACVSYPLSIDFPPFVLSTGAWVVPRVRLVNFHVFFSLFETRSAYWNGAASVRDLCRDLLFSCILISNVVKLYFICYL